MAEPELRFTPSGKAVCNFRIVENDRKRSADGGWEDGDATYLGVTVWGAQAENIVESVEKGDRVVVVGKLKQRNYETREGEKRTVFDIDAFTVGVSLMWNSVKINRVRRERPAEQRSGPEQEMARGPVEAAADEPPPF